MEPTQNLHFDIWVRIAVGIHGSQVNTAHNTHDETAQLGVVHEGNQNPTTLLYIAGIFPRLEKDRQTRGDYFRKIYEQLWMNCSRNLPRSHMREMKHCLVLVEGNAPGCTGGCISLYLWMEKDCSRLKRDSDMENKALHDLSPNCTHRDSSLKTHVKVFLLVRLQFLQCHSGFSNKLIMPKLVFVTDREPAKITREW